MNKTAEIAKLPFKKLLIIAVLTNIGVVVLYLVFKNRIPPLVPLFYGMPESTDQLAARYLIILPCLISLTVIAVNSVAAIIIKSDFIKKILAAASLFTTALSVITILEIAFLVGNF